MPAAPATPLRGRTCLVTGASAGIGREVARGLARLGARVVLGCRSAERGEAARREIAAATGNPEVEVGLVDLASQASIRAFAERLLARERRLHVLVNNAGIWSQARRESPDGIELTWATNMLGYFLLTELLRERLSESAPARIVSVASRMAGGLDLDDVEFRKRSYRGADAYSQSKQANRMWTWALARRLADSGVTANAAHPGGVNTELFRKAGGIVGLAASAYARMRFKTPEQGADTPLWLATSPDLADVSGRFWADRGERHCEFRNERAEEALWALCQRMTAGSGGRP